MLFDGFLAPFQQFAFLSLLLWLLAQCLHIDGSSVFPQTLFTSADPELVVPQERHASTGVEQVSVSCLLCFVASQLPIAS